MKNLIPLELHSIAINEGVMSEIHIMAQEARNVKEFIKEFMAEYGDKVKDNAETRKWLESMYNDTINEKSKGLWANIHAKRKKGKKPARKGSKAYKKAKAAADKLNNESVDLDIDSLNSKELKEISISIENFKLLSRNEQDLFLKNYSAILPSNMVSILKSYRVDEAFIGPFVFNDKMSDEELKAMYQGALDGYANHSRGFEHPKSKYKQAYQAIEKILKKRGVSVDESINEAIDKATTVYQVATPSPQAILVGELKQLFPNKAIVTEVGDADGYESVLMFNLSRKDLKNIQDNVGDVLVWKYPIGKAKSVIDGPGKIKESVVNEGDIADTFDLILKTIDNHKKIKPVRPYFNAARRMALKSRGLKNLKDIHDHLDKNLKDFTVTKISKGNNYPSQESFRVIDKNRKIYSISMDLDEPGEFDVAYSDLNESVNEKLNLSDLKYQIPLSIENTLGFNPRSFKGIKKEGKKFRLSLSSYFGANSLKTVLDDVNSVLGLDLKILEGPHKGSNAIYFIGESVNEKKAPFPYNLGYNGRNDHFKYAEEIGMAVKDIEGIRDYHKMAQRGGKTAVQDLSSRILITTYGQPEIKDAIVKALKGVDDNIDLKTIKSNYDAPDRERSKHEQDNDMWKWEIQKKEDFHSYKRKYGDAPKPDKEFTREHQMEFIDMLAPYSTTQHQLADIDITSLEDFLKYAADHVSPANLKKVTKRIKKEYPKLESVQFNEGKKYKARELNNLWYGVYGEPLSNYSSFLSELEYNYRRGISKEEIADLWDKHYGEDMEQDYSGFYDKLEESVNEGKMPERYVGLDDIVYVKVKEDSRGANYKLYWRGHDVEVGGRRFDSEKELESFAADYILSNQVYNKLKYKKPQAIPESKHILTLESFLNEEKTKKTNKTKIKVGDLVNQIYPEDWSASVTTRHGRLKPKYDVEWANGLVLSVKGKNVEVNTWSGKIIELPIDQVEYNDKWNSEEPFARWSSYKEYKLQEVTPAKGRRKKVTYWDGEKIVRWPAGKLNMSDMIKVAGKELTTSALGASKAYEGDLDDFIDWYLEKKNISPNDFDNKKKEDIRKQLSTKYDIIIHPGVNPFYESVSETKNVLTLESFLNEALPTQEIDPDKFPHQWKKDKQFFRQGYKDGSNVDDTVETRPVKIPASQLKPSQDAVYLGKALGMAIGGVEGGSLDAIISQDNRILDGHHRWAATIFNNPKARVGGVQAQLKIGDLIPVLRQAGDALGNNRGLPPKGGDVNIFKATLQDVRDAVYDGKHMNPQFYNREQAVEWFERTGEKKIQNSLNILQRVGPPAGAPPRAEMPKVEPEQVKNVANKLAGGAIDVRKPYVGDPEVKGKGGLQNYLK